MSKEIDVEQKLREIERKYGGFANFELITLCNGKDKYIADLQSQLAITEKALELACKEITGSCEYCSYKTRIECPVEADCLDEKINYFKTKAKEMMKSE